MGWPGPHIARLTVLWDEGMKAPDIARVLNREFGTAYTKNAVVGQKHRAGLANRHSRTPKNVVSATPHPLWTAVRFINGAPVTLDQFVVTLTNDWNKTPSQIAERINEEWPISLIKTYANHLLVYHRLRTLNVEPVKTQKTPKTSNVTGAFGHAPAHYETAPKHPDITKRESSVDRMGTNERNSCKWPTSNDARNMTMCGRFVTVGAYCETHGALAYQIKPSKRRTSLISKPQEFAIGVAKANGNRKHHIVECDDAPAIADLPHTSEWLSNG